MFSIFVVQAPFIAPHQFLTVLEWLSVYVWYLMITVIAMKLNQ